MQTAIAAIFGLLHGTWWGERLRPSKRADLMSTPNGVNQVEADPMVGSAGLGANGVKRRIDRRV